MLAVLQPEASATTALVDVHDARGDVRITTTKGLTGKERRSIDLHRIIATAADDGLRLAVRVRRVASSERFDQWYFIFLESPRQFAAVEVRVARMRAWAGMEGAPTPQGYAQCRLEPSVNPRRTQLIVLVPYRCIPEEASKVSVDVYTTPRGGRAGQVLYSRDRRGVGDTVDLTPGG